VRGRIDPTNASMPESKKKSEGRQGLKGKTTPPEHKPPMENAAAGGAKASEGRRANGRKAKYHLKKINRKKKKVILALGANTGQPWKTETWRIEEGGMEEKKIRKDVPKKAEAFGTTEKNLRRLWTAVALAP